MVKSLLRTEQSDWLNERISEAESLLLSELLNREKHNEIAGVASAVPG
ncbi:MAG: hypothetical protein R3C12_16630 [Planctomycetaceae bacterium]